MSEILTKLSHELADVAESVGQSIVRVEGRRRQPASGIVWSADGLIITANHVLSRDDDLWVGLPDDHKVPAVLIGRDPTTDLALLRIEAKNLTLPEWLPPAELRVGRIAIALGRPGRKVQAALGVISALGEGWRSGGGGQIDQYIQADVVMYPGFSGGPLADASGRIAGLNSSGLLRDAAVSLPLSTLQRVAQALATHGRIRRGYLGVGVQTVRLPETLASSIGQTFGLLLISVEPETPAAAAGLTLGDTLLLLDGQPLQTVGDLLGILSGDRVGSEVEARILRGGELHDLRVRVGERDEQRPAPSQ